MDEAQILGRIVAPLAGAWLEIQVVKDNWLPVLVAPLAGAWIEIIGFELHPEHEKVAPLAGAWIEIRRVSKRNRGLLRRSPRGSVD